MSRAESRPAASAADARDSIAFTLGSEKGCARLPALLKEAANAGQLT
jgi:hypothetical protein